MALMVMMTQSTGLDNVRRRSDLPSRDSLIMPRRCLSRDGVWREGRAVTDSIAVSEDSVLPLCLHNKLVTSPHLITDCKTHQRSAVSILRAAGSKGWAPVAPLDPLCSEGSRCTAPLSSPVTKEASPDLEQSGQQQHHQLVHPD